MSNKGRPTTYRGVRFDSIAEAEFARMCDAKHHRWWRTPITFLDDQRYTPDFIVRGFPLTRPTTDTDPVGRAKAALGAFRAAGNWFAIEVKTEGNYDLYKTCRLLTEVRHQAPWLSTAIGVGKYTPLGRQTAYQWAAHGFVEGRGSSPTDWDPGTKSLPRQCTCGEFAYGWNLSCTKCREANNDQYLARNDLDALVRAYGVELQRRTGGVPFARLNHEINQRLGVKNGARADASIEKVWEVTDWIAGLCREVGIDPYAITDPFGQT